MTPLPASAVAISLNPNGLNVFLPPVRDGGRGHTIVIPADAAGMKALLDILRSREAGEVAFGTPGAPTQRQVIDPRILQNYRGAITRNNDAKADRKREADRNNLAVALTLRELGL